MMSNKTRAVSRSFCRSCTDPSEGGCCVYTESMDDLRSPKFWRAITAEAIGTLFLTLIGCGACTGWEKFPNRSQSPSSTNNSAPIGVNDSSAVGGDFFGDGRGPAAAPAPRIEQIALAFGLAVATMAWCIGHVSGCHINPAVTVGMLAARKISVAKALLYIFAQCVGATVGAAILKGLTPVKVQGSLGSTTLHPGLTPFQGFGVELFITCVLVLTVFASCDPHRNDLANGSAPLAIGLAVTLCHLFAIKYTGSSMNSARTFGPAVVTGIWDNHWVYWAGPVLGGVAAAGLYQMLFAASPSASLLAAAAASARAHNTYDGDSVNSDDDHKQSYHHREQLISDKKPNGNGPFDHVIPISQSRFNDDADDTL